MINTHNQHCWIADFGYYYDLKDFTPKSWDQNNFWNAPEGQYVVKGKTNSKKHQWKTHMFAKDKLRAIQIGNELLQDGLIYNQGVIYREFVPFKALDFDEINEMPFLNEWRIFYYKKTRLTYGYYWSSAPDEIINKATMTDEGLNFADMVAGITSDCVDFFVLDIAEKQDGGWMLIEMNDGQCSGLSENNPDTLYANLKSALV